MMELRVSESVKSRFACLLLFRRRGERECGVGCSFLKLCHRVQLFVCFFFLFCLLFPLEVYLAAAEGALPLFERTLNLSMLIHLLGNID